MDMDGSVVTALGRECKGDKWQWKNTVQNNNNNNINSIVIIIIIIIVIKT